MMRQDAAKVSEVSPRRACCRWAIGLCAAMLILGGLGCSSTLDDGYRPLALTASSSQRRAFYATPFTPEAAEGGPDQGMSPAQHRPGGY
jgi:hypothetical protein